MKIKIFAILILSLLLSGALQPETPTQDREKVLSQLVGNWLANWHYSGRKIDDDFSAKSFAQYTKYLDNGKSFLIQADLDTLKAYTYKIDDELRGRRFFPAAPGQAASAPARAAGPGHVPGDPGQAVRFFPG